MGREMKLAGFVLLLIVVFLGAHAAGATIGPLSTNHSQVSYTGTGGTGGGMNMGGSGGGQQPAPARTRIGGR
jgi:hypothetical protein